MNATSNEGQTSGVLTAFGTWNTSANVAPTAVSVTPASGSGTSQTFSFAFADANGYQDLNTVSAIFNTSTGTANACYVYRSEEHTSELQSLRHLVCRLLLEKK